MISIYSKWVHLSQGKKSAIVFTVSMLFTKGIAIITTPIFTRLMTESQIGIVGIYSAWVSILGVVISLGLTSGGFFIGLKDFSHSRDQYVSSILTLTTISSILFIVVIFIYPNIWVKILGLPFDLIVLMLIGFVLTPAYETWISRQRFENKYKVSGTITILSSIISTTLAVLLVIKLKLDGSSQLAEGRLFATYGINYIVYAVIFISIFIKGKTLYNRQYWKSSLVLSVPLIGHSFASQILSVSDRMMIDNIIGTAEVGLYTILYSVGTLSMILWSAMNTSYVAYLYQNIDNANRNKDIRNTSASLLKLFSVVVVLISLFSPEIVKILATDQYLEYIDIVPPIIAGIYLTSVANFYSNILVYERNTWFIMCSTCIAAGINIGLNYLLLPKFGFQIAAYTTLIAYIVYALLQAICANYLFKKKIGGNFIYSNIRMLGISSLTILCCIICIPLYSFMMIRYVFIILLAFVLFMMYKLKRHAIKN